MLTKVNKMVVSLLVILCLIGTTAYAVTSARLDGTSRYETAVKMSSENWVKADTVVLAYGEDFPDALCAAPLAARLNAPILLTDKKNLNTVTLNEIIRLQATKVFLIGGVGVISENVEKSLTDKNITVTRLFENDRYETSLSVAEYMASTFNLPKEIAIATGDNFPDALSIAAISGIKNMPILLSPKSNCTSKVLTFINNANPEKCYVIGGVGVLSSAVEQSLTNALRLGGDNRYDTNIQILEKFASDINLDNLYVATGENYPDALAGSIVASKAKTGILLTSAIPAKETNSFLLSIYNAIM